MAPRRADAHFPVRARDRPGAGRAGARERGADEPSRHDEGQLEVAAGAGPAERSARETPSRGGDVQRPRRPLEQDLERQVGRAAPLEQRDRAVEVDVPVERDHDRRLGVVAGRLEALDAPGGDPFPLPLAAGGSDWCLDCHVAVENVRHVWRRLGAVTAR